MKQIFKKITALGLAGKATSKGIRVKKSYQFLMISLLVVVVGLCGCVSDNTADAPTVTTSGTTTSEQEALPETESEDPPAALASREEVVEIVGDLLGRYSQLDYIFYFGYKIARDEDGHPIFYRGEDFGLDDPESYWVELVEFEYTKAELMKMAEDLYTESAGGYSFFFISEYYHEENGKIYMYAAEGAHASISYYPETLEIKEQTESLISIECEGFNETYEQQMLVSLTAVMDGGVWKIDALALR